jgi:hypothetical protein
LPATSQSPLVIVIVPLVSAASAERTIRPDPLDAANVSLKGDGVVDQLCDFHRGDRQHQSGEDNQTGKVLRPMRGLEVRLHDSFPSEKQSAAIAALLLLESRVPDVGEANRDSEGEQSSKGSDYDDQTERVTGELR